MKKFLPAIITFVLVISCGLALAACSQKSNSTNTVAANETPADPKWIALAQALTKAGAKMYGAFWCSHCQDQKAEFGSAFKDVTYVECAPDKANPYKQSSACKAANIEGYPTWIFADGSRVESVMTYDELSQKIGFKPAQ
jgi:hypothetical protein